LRTICKVADMAIKNVIKHRQVKSGLIVWASLSLIFAAICGFLIVRDPQRIIPERVWVGTDRRTDLAATYAGKKILGDRAWFAPDYLGADIEKVCPDLAGKVPVNVQGRNEVDVLRIDVDGSLHCVMMGESARFEDLEVRLNSISKKWMTLPDPAGGQEIYFGNAELSVHRTDQPYLTIALLVATAFLGTALGRVGEGIRVGASRV
jgi:hypothetical protein